MIREIELMKFRLWLCIAKYHKRRMSIYLTQMGNYLNPNEDPEHKFQQFAYAFLYHNFKFDDINARLDAIKERIKKSQN